MSAINYCMPPWHAPYWESLGILIGARFKRLRDSVRKGL